jgi:hypothetical protein
MNIFGPLNCRDIPAYNCIKPRHGASILIAAVTTTAVIKLAAVPPFDCKYEWKMHGCDEWICIPALGISLANSPGAWSRSEDLVLAPRYPI